MWLSSAQCGRMMWTNEYEMLTSWFFETWQQRLFNLSNSWILPVQYQLMRHSGNEYKLCASKKLALNEHFAAVIFAKPIRWAYRMLTIILVATSFEKQRNHCDWIYHFILLTFWYLFHNVVAGTTFISLTTIFGILFEVSAILTLLFMQQIEYRFVETICWFVVNLSFDKLSISFALFRPHKP